MVCPSGGGSGGKSGATNGDAGQPGEVVRAANGLISVANLPKALSQRDKLDNIIEKIKRSYPGMGTAEEKAANVADRKAAEARHNKLREVIAKSIDRLTGEARGEMLTIAKYGGSTGKLKKMIADGTAYKGKDYVPTYKR
jgi:hypothetical protein